MVLFSRSDVQFISAYSVTLLTLKGKLISIAKNQSMELSNLSMKSVSKQLTKTRDCPITAHVAWYILQRRYVQ